MNMTTVCFLAGSSLLAGWTSTASAWSLEGSGFADGELKTSVALTKPGELRSYALTSNAPLRDNLPAGGQVEFGEDAQNARIRSGNTMFDALYALASHEARENSVPQIQDWGYGNNQPLALSAFETGRLWHYVWTRDLAYATHLGLAGFDTERATHSLLFKASANKPSVAGGVANQIIQDTGSGGSYPISTDRVVWILGASEVLHHLPTQRQSELLKQVYPALRDTLEQDRRLVFDVQDGLYRGEQSFLDWREQTYPLWTKDNVLPIGTSKALSVNVANYFALRTASDYAARLGYGDEQKRYSKWADDLKEAINARFYDAEAGLYSTYLLDDSDHPIRVQRFDLLGESLAILLGVASQAQAQKLIANYPTGQYGPPVVWPQERSVPIYHNHALWPFVTAYWIKAARQANNAEAVNQGIYSLVRGAAINLSNMENLDLRTGQAFANHDGLQGPVINSHRQVWSVAGYLSMVQDVVFGLETSWDGVRFAPFIPAQLRNDVFGETDLIELRNLQYQGKTINARVHLPRTGIVGGACRIERAELNGRPIASGFIAAASLGAVNTWDIFLSEPAKTATPAPALRLMSDADAVFAPAQPSWEEVGQGGITLENGLLTLHFRHENATQVSFNVYRDGQLCAQNVKGTSWTDTNSRDFQNTAHFYSVAAVDARSGNVSHLAPTRSYLGEGARTTLLAKDMENRGGNLVNNHHFENWGQMPHELRVREFSIPRDGRYQVRAEFSNGAGPINSGITCAVKRVRILGSQLQVVAGGYFVMPQSGDWKRFDLSSIVRANLKAGERYSLWIGEDEYSRNMSYLQNNERYTAASGGGEAPYNYVNIASVQLVRVSN